jgi:membrane protein required for colicin V production
MHPSQWTFLDFVFALIVLISVVLAVTKGLVREIVSVVALIGGFVLAVLYYPVPAAWFKTLLKTEALADLTGFLVIFVGCLVIGGVISFLINKFVKAASLEWVDRLLGALFGFLRGWLIASIIALALVAFPVQEQLLARSALAPFLLAGARAAVLVVPPELKAKFNQEYKKILDVLNQKRPPA